MKFSILIPVYNEEEAIVRAVESVKKQTFPDWEIVIVNDGSTDKTLEVCQGLAKTDSRIIVANKANSGVADARNMAIDLSRGEYIIFLDSDDTIMDSCLEDLLLCIEKEKCELVISNYCVMRMHNIENARKITRSENMNGPEEISKLIEASLKTIVWEKAEWYGNLRSVSCGKCFCRRIIQDCGIRFASGLKYGEDMIFLLNYLTNVSKVCFFDKPLYCYIMNDGSTMHTRKWEDFSQGELYYKFAENIVNGFCGKHGEMFDVESALSALWLETAKADWDCILKEPISFFEKRKLIRMQLNSDYGKRSSKKNKHMGRKQAFYMLLVRRKLVIFLMIICYGRMIKRRLEVQDV